MVAATYSVRATDSEIIITTREANYGLYEAVVSVVNNPGIAGYNLVIEFDNTKLTPVSIEEGNALTGGMIFISNLSGATQEQIAEMSAVTAVWGAAQDAEEDGVLFTVLFSVSDEAAELVELHLASRGIGNTSEEDLDFILTSATIELEEEALFGEPRSGLPDEPGRINATTIIIVSLSATVLVLVVCLAAKSKLRKRQPSRYGTRT